MKYLFFAAALAVTAPVFAANAGMSLSIGQPGFYGRLDIGNYPRPQLVYQRPIVIERVSLGHPPIYLHVPPGHAKNWRKHCREYNACGESVYFVQDTWYDREYVPRYQEHHGDRRHDRRDEHRDEGHGDQNDRHGRDHDHGHDH